jgi:hypothetical protein
MGAGFRLFHKEGGVVGHPKQLDYEERYAFFRYSLYLLGGVSLGALLDEMLAQAVMTQSKTNTHWLGHILTSAGGSE